MSDFYHSWSGYGDELAWAAAWLLRATGDQLYQVDVDKHYAEFNLSRQPYEFSWDEKTAGAQVLMAKITQQQSYKQQAETFCNYVVNQAPRTPKGLVFLAPWGSLRHASNAAFLCLQVKKKKESLLIVQYVISFRLLSTGCRYWYSYPRIRRFCITTDQLHTRRLGAILRRRLRTELSATTSSRIEVIETDSMSRKSFLSLSALAPIDRQCVIGAPSRVLNLILKFSSELW